MKKVFAIAMLMLAAGCMPRLPKLTLQQVAKAQERWPGTAPEALAEGRAMYSARCSSCHTLYSPASLSSRGWEDITEDMVDRAKLKPDEQEKVLRYLWAATVDAKTD